MATATEDARAAGVVRKAVLDDAEDISSVIEAFSEKGEMLPRPLVEVYDNLRDFFVFDDEGAVRGVASLHIWGPDLGEIRSLAVSAEHARRGIGTRLVNACLDEAAEIGLKRVFALTYARGFFESLGFEVVDKLKLPQKIWGDCTKCGKFPSCDETAVMKRL